MFKNKLSESPSVYNMTFFQQTNKNISGFWCGYWSFFNADRNVKSCLLTTCSAWIKENLPTCYQHNIFLTWNVIIAFPSWFFFLLNSLIKRCASYAKLIILYTDHWRDVLPMPSYLYYTLINKELMIGSIMFK